MSKLNVLQRAIEVHLERIQSIVGPDYELTLVANHTGPKDADILLTTSTREKIVAVVDRFLPENDKAEPTPGVGQSNS